MHWLAFVLSDHPHQDPNRDDTLEESPRRPVSESLPRSAFANRRVSLLNKPAIVLS